MSPFDATVVERIQEAGLVCLGKTNCDEFAMGSTTANSAYGKTFNPWNEHVVPGGSSGGSASCVAARLTPAATATDTADRSVSLQPSAASPVLSHVRPSQPLGHDCICLQLGYRRRYRPNGRRLRFSSFSDDRL